MHKYEHVLLQDFNPDHLEWKELCQAVCALPVCVKALSSICADPYVCVCAHIGLHTCVHAQIY